MCSEYYRSTECCTAAFWSYMLAAVLILGSAPSDVSLLGAAQQLTATLCFLCVSHCFRSCKADASPAFPTYMLLTWLHFIAAKPAKNDICTYYIVFLLGFTLLLRF